MRMVEKPERTKLHGEWAVRGEVLPGKRLGRWLLAGDGVGDDVREDLPAKDTLQKLWGQGRDAGAELPAAPHHLLPVPVFPEGLGSPPALACGVLCLCFFHLEKSHGGSC